MDNKKINGQDERDRNAETEKNDIIKTPENRKKTQVEPIVHCKRLNIGCSLASVKAIFYTVGFRQSKTAFFEDGPL